MTAHASAPRKPLPAGIGQRLRKLSNDDLLFGTMLAARRERALTISILHHLNEIARRRLYLELGYMGPSSTTVRGASTTRARPRAGAFSWRAASVTFQPC